jgi:hypothetical protein
MVECLFSVLTYTATYLHCHHPYSPIALPSHSSHFHSRPKQSACNINRYSWFVGNRYKHKWNMQKMSIESSPWLLSFLSMSNGTGESDSNDASLDL